MYYLYIKSSEVKVSLFVGLGNPGAEYALSRHNAGYMFLDYLSDKFGAVEVKSRNGFELSSYSDNDISTLKPQEFMNNSGMALQKYLKYKDHDTEEIVIVHDDLDLKLGEFKIQKGKSPKQHNGISSIEKVVGLKETYRLRIGIENRVTKLIPGSSYVLMKFDEDELQILSKTFDEIWKSFEKKEVRKN